MRHTGPSSSRFTAGSAASRALLITLAALSLALYLWRQFQATGALSGFPLDDAFIHLTFADNIAQGNGLAFLSDRPVAGSTAPLWTALLSPGLLLLPGAGWIWAKALGVLFFVLGGLELGALTRRLGARPAVATLAGALLVCTDTLIFSALSGMEVPLFIWLVLFGMRCWVQEQDAGVCSVLTSSTWLFALACLARPEGLVILGLALLWRLVSTGRLVPPPWRRLVAGLLLVGVTLVPTALLFYSWHGSMLPTTFGVKAGGAHRLLPSSFDLYRIGDVLFRVQPWMTALALGGGLVLIQRRRPLLPLLVFLAFPMALSAMANPDRPVLLGNFGRYAFPLIPLAVLLGAMFVDELLELLERSTSGQPQDGTRQAARRLLPWALGLLLIAPTLRASWQGAARYGLSVQNVGDSDVAAARWIAEHLPQARIGAQDIGALGFFAASRSANEKAGVTVIDLVGLVNPEIVPFVRGDVDGTPGGLEGMLQFAERQRVDHLLLFPASYGGLEVLERLRPSLELRQRWRLERNVAMAADELVLLRLAPRSRLPRLPSASEAQP